MPFLVLLQTPEFGEAQDAFITLPLEFGVPQLFVLGEVKQLVHYSTHLLGPRLGVGTALALWLPIFSNLYRRNKNQ